MSATGANAFEGPSAIMARLFGNRAAGMGGHGGQAGTEEQEETVPVKDASATGCGDLISQVGVKSHPSGIGAIPPKREGLSSLHSAAGSVITAIKAVAAEAMPASMISGKKTSASGCPYMTSVFGMSMQDPTHTLQIAGHPVISDVISMEKQQTFNRQKILERAVHACGSGALGYFVTTRDSSDITKAKFLHGVGTKTPVAARFSTTTFGKEYPDEARNPRGLAFKFYTEEGNFDLMSINFPAFFCRDGALGSDAVRSQQRNPNNFQVGFDSILDFMSLVPESMLANLWFWSDHGTPRGWMHMDGYPIHAFKYVNDAGKITYVKYRLVSVQGIQNLSQEEAQRVAGIDPDFSKREMWQHIHSGGKAEWIVQLQQLSEADIVSFAVNPFDCSKPWPEARYPWHEIGRIILDKNPENFHRDVEQLAFSPGRLVPGIEPTPDPLLQFRCWLYLDAQIHRLGANYHQIPVNSPWKVKSLHPITRDGAMRVDSNGGHESHYFPTSARHMATAATTSASLSAPGAISAVPNPESNWAVEVQPKNAVLSRGPSSNTEGHPTADFLPGREFWLNMPEVDRAALCQNLAFAMCKVSRKEIVVRWLLACYRTDEALALQQVAALQTECARSGHKAPITVDELMSFVKEVDEKPLVNAVYMPVALKAFQ